MNILQVNEAAIQINPEYSLLESECGYHKTWKYVDDNESESESIDKKESQSETGPEILDLPDSEGLSSVSSVAENTDKYQRLYKTLQYQHGQLTKRHLKVCFKYII